MKDSAALLRLLVERLDNMDADIRGLRLAVEGRSYRDRLIVELAGAVGLGPTWAAAQAVSMILAGAQPAPAGAEHLAGVLRGCQLSARQVLRILQAAAAQAAADRSTALCQWPIGRHDRAIATDDEGSNDG